MDSFDKATLRLKDELNVKTDKAVAEALGLSPVAWVGRRKRDNFPETELLALKAKRPDLHIDVSYVLTGRRQAGHARRITETLLGTTGAADAPTLSSAATAAIRKQAAEDAARAPYIEAIAERAPWCTLDDLEWVIGFMDLCRTDRGAADRQKRLTASPQNRAATVSVVGDGNVTAGGDMTLGQTARGRSTRTR